MVKLRDKKFWKIALSLALPIAMQNLLTSSFTLIDTIMIGQLGDVSLSAVGMAGQLSWLLNMVLFGFASGGALFISQYWGIKDINGIQKSIGISVVSSFVASVVFVFAGFLFPSEIIHIFNKEAFIIEEGTKYLQIVVWSYPAIALNITLCAGLRAVERVRIPVVVSLITTATNIFLDYALIFGKFGFPKMGIEGGALATVIAAWTAPVVIAVSAVVTKNILYDAPRKFFDFGRGFIKNYFAKSVPVVFNESIWGLGTVMFSIIYANIGYEEYAAVTICKTIENLVFVFFAGLGNACSIMVGKSIGCGDIERAKTDAKRFTLLTPMLGILIGSIVIICRRHLISLFNMSDNISNVTFDTAMGILVVFGIIVSIRNIPYIMVCGIFRPGGETTAGAKYDIICTWGFSLVATIIAAFVLKLPFVAIILVMYIFDDIPKSTMCLRYFFSDRWIKPVTEEGRRAVAQLK